MSYVQLCKCLKTYQFKTHCNSHHHHHLFVHKNAVYKMTMCNGERDIQGSVRALKAAPKLHSYNSTRNKNSDTQKYTHT